MRVSRGLPRWSNIVFLAAATAAAAAASIDAYYKQHMHETLTDSLTIYFSPDFLLLL